MWLGQHTGLTRYAAVRCWQFLPLPRRSPPFRDFHLWVHDPFFLSISASTAASLPRGSDTADLKETGGRFCGPRTGRRRQPLIALQFTGFYSRVEASVVRSRLKLANVKIKKDGGCIIVSFTHGEIKLKVHQWQSTRNVSSWVASDSCSSISWAMIYNERTRNLILYNKTNLESQS